MSRVVCSLALIFTCGIVDALLLRSAQHAHHHLRSTSSPEIERRRSFFHASRHRSCLVVSAHNARSPQNSNRGQPNNKRSAAIALNKEIISSRTAHEILSLFDARRDEFNEVNVATAIHRLARMRPSRSDTRLLRLIDDATSSVSLFGSRGLSNVCWAAAKLRLAAPALYEAIARAAPAKIGEFTPQDFANTVWAFSTAGVAAPALYDAIARAAPAKIGEFEPQGLSQLYQVLLFLREKEREPEHALVSLLSGIEAELRGAFSADEPSPSRSQRDVSKALSRIGWAHEFEYVTAEGLSLDMAHPASKFAVEFDGPSHYHGAADDGPAARTLNGRSRLKQRVLRHLGWKTAYVPYFEWDALKSREAKDEYLRSCMAALRKPNDG